MRLPLSWLHDYIDPGLDPRELATQLAMSGTEVDRVDHHGVDALEHFVVGKVLSAEPHPDADRLKVCMVDVGDRPGRSRSSAVRRTWQPGRRSPSRGPDR